ncbi:hypothetical protein FRB95_001949 [Tulasnella sp. JGI-2019a]|nr:hypothetical protein FRB95_001949 [Tulasnella sp. JGI-2019a]
MSSPPVITTGVPPKNPGAAPKPYPRLPIETLAKEGEYRMQWCLYVQAVADMQKMSETEAKSWYQISGIHGLPHEPWDGVNNPDPRKGYCEHHTILFPTWHRPYMALYEQLLHDCALKIANEYTVDTDLWQDAAYKLRAPYWDWAATPIPALSIIALRNLMIVMKDGKEQRFPNPFLGYSFHPGFKPGTNLPNQAVIDRNANPRKMRPKTVRCSPNGSIETDLQALIDSLWGNGLSWKSKTHDTIMYAEHWDQMHERPGLANQPVVPVNNFESIHDDVHVQTGGNGHMSSIPVAGFDPIFWLHHSNVDRLLALWQAIHYEAFMDEETANKGLPPFRNSPSTFWTSSEVRKFIPLNYTYPEFEGLDLTDQAAVKVAIRKKVHELYGPTEAQLLQLYAMSKNIPQGQGSQQPMHGGGSALGRGAQVGSPRIQPHTRMGWTVIVKSKQYQFANSYSVLIFVGAPPASEHDWRTSPTYAGAFCAFVNSSPEECSNCMEHTDLVVEGYVPLTGSLADAGVKSLGSDVVVPYLKENLHWRIQKTDASIVEAKDMEEFEVGVISVEMEYKPEEELYKVISDRTYHPEITAGKPGGRKA